MKASRKLTKIVSLGIIFFLSLAIVPSFSPARAATTGDPLFSDDFNGSGLDMSKWAMLDVTDGISVGGGYLTIGGFGAGHKRINSIPTFSLPQGGSITAHARIQLTGQYQKFGFNIDGEANNLGGFYFDTFDDRYGDPTNTTRIIAWAGRAYGSNTPLISSSVPVTWGTFHDFSINWAASKVVFLIDNQEVAHVDHAFTNALPIGIWNDRNSTMLTDDVEVTHGRTLIAPFSIGETWYVCRGYNIAKHADEAEIDLSISPESVAGKSSLGCNPDTRDASTGRRVIAPVSGDAYQVPGYPDHVCINFDDGGGSAWIAHMDPKTIIPGTPVRPVHVDAGITVLGLVNKPSTAPGQDNGNYAHIHLHIRSDRDCQIAHPAIPFDDADQMRIACAPEMPYTGVLSEYRGVALGRCEALLLKVKMDGNGGGIVYASPGAIACPVQACSTLLSAGADVILTAQPDSNSVFVGWSGPKRPTIPPDAHWGQDCSGNHLCELKMDTVKLVSATFAPLADPMLTTSAAPDPGRLNKKLTYTITVSNKGPSVATAVTVTDYLSRDTILLGVPHISQGQCHLTTISTNITTRVTCKIGKLAVDPTGAVTLTITVRPKVAGIIPNTAIVAMSSDIVDNDLNNNIVTHLTTVTQ